MENLQLVFLLKMENLQSLFLLKMENFRSIEISEVIPSSVYLIGKFNKVEKTIYRT